MLTSQESYSTVWLRDLTRGGIEGAEDCNKAGAKSRAGHISGNAFRVRGHLQAAWFRPQ